MADYDVIVIGAGLGGLSAGAILAHQGRSVLVLEQSSHIGGCCATFEKEGYHFDLGASIVEVVKPIAMAFRALGTSIQEEIDLIPCDPVMSVIYDDGDRVTYPLSIEETGRVIAEISPEDGRRWYDFVEYMQEFTHVALDTFFTNPADDLGDMISMFRKDPRLLKFLPLFISSYEDVIRKFFKDEKVLATMGYQALYFGMPPALVPGAFALIPYTEHEGIYYPRGGMGKIPEALARCGKRDGMEIKTEAFVKRVLVGNGRVKGVLLADETTITTDLVVSDINAKTLYLDLIGEEHLPTLVRRGVKSYPYSKAVPMIYVGVDYEPPLEAHHSIISVTPEQVNKFWWNNVEKGKLPERTFGLICWPTKSDPSLAPEGHHVLNLIQEGFYHLEGTTWDEEKPRFVESVLDRLSECALPGLKEHVQVVECVTPLDFERRLKLPEGAIYALQQDLTASAVFRPSARSKAVKGLYLAGSSTHPGGGVPTTIASGLIAATLIDKHE